MRPESVLFIDTVNELLASINKAEYVIKGLMQVPNLLEVVTEISDTANKVTILEPAVLHVQLRKLTDLCDDITLISIIQETDPKYELRNTKGDSWYELAKGPKVVTAIQAIRECFGSIRIDVRDGKRIYELVQNGTI